LDSSIGSHRNRALLVLADATTICRGLGVGHGPGDYLLSGAQTFGEEDQTPWIERSHFMSAGHTHRYIAS